MTEIRNESAYVQTAMRNAAANEVVHNHTKQRKFERSFESRDIHGSRAAIVEGSDRGTAARLIGSAIDKSIMTSRRLAVMNRAAARLPRRNPMLRRLLWAIYRNGTNRAETMCELGISERTYRRGVKFLLNFYSKQ